MPNVDNGLPTDEQILAKIKSSPPDGRDIAFEQLLEKYGKLIWYVVRRYYRNETDAMDAYQESCIKIFKGLFFVKLPENGLLKSWICGVTANSCIDGLRKKKNAEIATPDDVLYEYNTGSLATPSAEDEALAKARVGEILKAIEDLPDNYKTLIILRDLNGLTYQELAEATGVNINTVKSRLSRARNHLQKLIN